MVSPRESEMEGFADRFAADGNWPAAISTAQMVLREYQAQAATDPQGYASLVDRTLAQIARLTAEADAAGAATHFQPSAFTRALVASSNPNPTAEDEAVIAEARAEAAQEGMSDYVNESLAGLAAAAGTAPARPADPDTQQAVALTVEFERLIKRERQRSRGVDGTTYEAEVTASVLPTYPARNLARRFARQSALLRRFGRHDDAVEAATRAGMHYSDRTDLDDTEKGYYAYSMLLLAEYFLAHRDAPSARGPAATAMKLFIEFRQRLIPGGIPDMVRAGLALAQCQAQLASTAAARQTLADVAHLADSLDSSFGGPVGEPGTMPGGWGLPIVVSRKEWKALRKHLTKLSKQLRP